MRALTQYVRLAEGHWRTWLPRRVAELERTGQLKAKLQEGAERTVTDTEALRQHFLQQGLTPNQAQQRAWEIVRERYLFLPPEE
jgi:DNA-binding TFAR19-related protein (PDSD5 family)